MDGLAPPALRSVPCPAGTTSTVLVPGAQSDLQCMPSGGVGYVVQGPHHRGTRPPPMEAPHPEPVTPALLTWGPRRG